MKRLAITAALTAASLLTIVPAAFAQAGGDFAIADANRDGKVTFSEARGLYPGLTKDLFRKADDNHNGTLDEAEYGELKGLSGAIGGSEGIGNNGG
jgi:hypothetical protein